MRAILIDPDLELCRFVSGFLSRAGHAVSNVPEVSLATALLRAESVDLVLTDLVLPGRPGAETLEALRREFPSLEVSSISASIHCTGYLRLAATLGGSHKMVESFMSPDLNRAIEASRVRAVQRRQPNALLPREAISERN